MLSAETNHILIISIIGSRRLKKGISLLLINICQVARCCLFMSVKLAIVETMTLIISDVVKSINYPRKYSFI